MNRHFLFPYGSLVLSCRKSRSKPGWTAGRIRDETGIELDFNMTFLYTRQTAADPGAGVFLPKMLEWFKKLRASNICSSFLLSLPAL